MLLHMKELGNDWEKEGEKWEYNSCNLEWGQSLTESCYILLECKWCEIMLGCSAA